MQKTFLSVSNHIYSAIKDAGFSMQEQKDDFSVVFTNNNISYKVIFDDLKNQFSLLKPKENDNINDWKIIASWLFDPENHNKKDAETIAEDFEQIIFGPNPETSFKPAKREKKENENNIDPLFFMNRLVTVFPDLKEEIQIEKETYNKFRGVTFAKEKVIPKMNDLLSNEPKNNKLKKFCNLLSDMYKVGNMDVRGIITIVLLNSIEDDEKLKKIENLISNDLKKAFKSSYKLRNKKIKPKKVKKSYLMSKIGK